MKQRSAARWWVLVLSAVGWLLVAPLKAAELSDDELNAEAPAEALSNLEPVPIDEVDEVVLEAMVEFSSADSC